MTSRGRYDGRLWRPAEGSRYEFLLEGMKVFDLEDGIMPWSFPLPELEPIAASPGLSAEIARRNVAAGRMAAAYDSTVMDEFRNAGLTERELALPGVQQLIAHYAICSRFLLVHMYEAATAGAKIRTGEKRPDKHLCQAIVFTAHLLHPELSPAKLAHFLNTGASSASKSIALGPDTVRRALAAYPKWLGGQCAPVRALSGKATVDHAAKMALEVKRRVELLLRVEQRCASDPRYRKFRGAALVREVERVEGFAVLVTKAERAERAA